MWSLSGGNEVALLYLLPLQLGTLNSSLTLAPNQKHWLKNYLKPLLVASNFSQVKFLTMEDQRVFAPYWMDRVSIIRPDKREGGSRVCRLGPGSDHLLLYFTNLLL